jgi:AcrR family transcriptional regulator
VWDAANSLFYERGIRAVGVAEIAASSGVAKPSLYRNFESKDGLVVAYLNEHSASDLNIVTVAREAHPNDPRQQLRYIVAATAEKIGGPDYRGCPLANAAIEFPDRDHPIRRRVDEHKASFLRGLTEIAADITADAAEDLAFSMAMLLEGASCAAQIFSGAQSARALVTTADAIIDAYGTP